MTSYMREMQKVEQAEKHREMLEIAGKEAYGNVDMINNPPHYNGGPIECIDAIQAALTPEEFRGYCKGNNIKYTWRENRKGKDCLLYTSPSPRDAHESRMPSSA